MVSKASAASASSIATATSPVGVHSSALPTAAPRRRHRSSLSACSGSGGSPAARWPCRGRSCRRWRPGWARPWTAAPGAPGRPRLRLWSRARASSRSPPPKVCFWRRMSARSRPRGSRASVSTGVASPEAARAATTPELQKSPMVSVTSSAISRISGDGRQPAAAASSTLPGHRGLETVPSGSIWK